MKTLVDTSTIRQSQLVVPDPSDLVAGRYRFMRLLGEGGMGNVYLAEDLLLARLVAIKTIRPELSTNEEVRSRIRRECRMHAAIGVHPHIITLYDTIEENGHIYLVMEYFDGETLAGQLAAATGSTGLALNTSLDVVRQLLQALACIHDHDIVHRDIKTSNILLRPGADGRPLAKLMDFGIARAETEPSDLTRLTSLGTRGPGTPAYMAPERIDPQTFGALCPATDLYAAGIILFEVLTGAPPFKGSMTEIFSGHLVQQPSLDHLPPDIPAGLETVLHKALAKKPADRYQDAEAFINALAVFKDERAASPLPAALEAPTLLAMGSGCAPLAGCGATMLDPALGRGRTTLPTFPQRWLYLVAALVLALSGYFLRAHLMGKPGSLPVEPAEKAATTAPGTAHPAEDQAAAKNTSALQEVEQVRQSKNIESMAAVDRNPRRNPDAQGWQVIEDRSRKIH